jgi:hypothetical protein
MNPEDVEPLTAIGRLDEQARPLQRLSGPDSGAGFVLHQIQVILSGAALSYDDRAESSALRSAIAVSAACVSALTSKQHLAE